MSRADSIRTKRGISKGQRAAQNLAALVAEVFMVTPVLEHRFAAEIAGGTGKGLRERIRSVGLKDWRFDLAIPEHKIAVEFDGGGFIAGRHNRGMGVIGDMHKMNTAVIHGWRVLRYTHTHHTTSQIMGDIARIIQP
jgi:very-short-patch-repair endonuclease